MFVWIATFEPIGDKPISFYGSTKEKAIKQLVECEKLIDPEEFGYKNRKTLYKKLYADDWIHIDGYSLYVEMVTYD